MSLLYHAERPGLVLRGRCVRAAELARVRRGLSWIEQESCPENGLGEGGHVAKHDLNDVPDRVGRILGPAATTQPPGTPTFEAD